jgi:hypothetical protein
MREGPSMTTADLKAIVINEKEMYVFNCSMRRKNNESDIAFMDLHSLCAWKKITLRGDTRPLDFVNFGLIPFIKRGETHQIVMMVGGP